MVRVSADEHPLLQPVTTCLPNKEPGLILASYPGSFPLTGAREESEKEPGYEARLIPDHHVQTLYKTTSRRDSLHYTSIPAILGSGHEDVGMR